MRSRRFVAWLVLAAAGSLAAPSLAGDTTGLKCIERGKDGSIYHTIRLDLAKMRACDDLSCRDLESAGQNVLKYDCAGQSCAMNLDSTETQIVSSAGPWVKEDHFTFNRVTREFRRQMSGMYGDRVVHDFRSDDSGICTADPPAAVQAPTN